MTFHTIDVTPLIGMRVDTDKCCASMRTGEKTVLAELSPGLDNCTLVGKRLFVLHISGAIHGILDEGRTRPLIDRELQWLLGLAVDETGRLFIADGVFTYDLRPGEALELAGTLFNPGLPGYTLGVTPKRQGSMS